MAASEEPGEQPPAPESIENGPAVTGQADMAYLNLRHGECDFNKDDGEECEMSARYFAINDHESNIAACGFHVPDRWLDDDEEFALTVYDRADYKCDKQVTKKVDGVGDRERVETVPCPFDASLLIVNHEKSDRDWPPMGFCLHHARPTWVEYFEEAVGEGEGET